MVKEGERVGALSGVKDEIVYVFGYGVYEGYHDAPVFGDEELFPNPRIKLDEGGHVFGYQCWWGAEDVIKEKVRKWEEIGYVVKKVDIKREEDN